MTRRPSLDQEVSGAAAVLAAAVAARITGAARLAAGSGVGRHPAGATWPMVAGIAAIGGMGFTVSLFIAELAYPAGPLLDAAKLRVLVASTLAAAIGTVVLLRTCR